LPEFSGEEFKTAFSCFVFSKEDPKGVDCIEKFRCVGSRPLGVRHLSNLIIRDMQTCFHMVSFFFTG